MIAKYVKPTKPSFLWYFALDSEGIAKQDDSFILTTCNYSGFRQCLENLVSGDMQDVMQEIIDGIATNPDNAYTLQFLGLDDLVCADIISPDAEGTKKSNSFSSFENPKVFNIIKTAETNLIPPVVSENYYNRLYERTKKYLSDLPESELLLDIFESGGNVWGPVYVQTFLKEKLEKIAETSQDRSSSYKAAAKSMSALLYLSMAHYNPEKGQIFNYKNAQDFLFAKKIQLFVTPNVAKGILNKIEDARKEFEIKYDMQPTGLKFNTNGQGFVFDKVQESYQKVEFELETNPEAYKTILQCYDANLQNYLQ